ncbi:phosphodiester glycosidase family protein [Lutibacter sp. B2]|nr:phosphodiester glycosidase family protein [Lutibacter sp. B2]
MKKLIVIITLIFMISFSSSFAISSHVTYVQNFPSVNKKARIIVIDMNNKNIKSVVGRAYNKMDSAQPLKDIVNSKNNESIKSIAAINGTYFSAYEGPPLPYGTIIEEGKVLHIGNYGSVIGFTKDNKMIMDNLNISIDGYINDQIDYYAWGINHPREEKDAIVIYTKEFKEDINFPSGKAVIVEDGFVKSIIQGQTNIRVEENQCIIVFNQDVSYLVDRFKIGDKVMYKCNIISKNIEQKKEASLKWTDVESAIGAGPSLIIDGKITADGLAEGFFEAKINTNRAQRSFIGFTKENKIFMGTVSNANLKELAQICTELGLHNAMCMDGGASSALYYEGKYVTNPGRNINNGLVFIEKME